MLAGWGVPKNAKKELSTFKSLYSRNIILEMFENIKTMHRKNKGIACVRTNCTMYTNYIGSWENVHKRGEGESQLVADVLRGLLRTEGPHVRSFTTVHVTCICTKLHRFRFCTDCPW
jgi:hypothetical protein